MILQRLWCWLVGHRWSDIGVLESVRGRALLKVVCCRCLSKQYVDINGNVVDVSGVDT